MITINFKKKIDAIKPEQKKVQALLDYIAGKLESGYTEELLIFLKIMKRYGSPSTEQLADELKESLGT